MASKLVLRRLANSASLLRASPATSQFLSVSNVSKPNHQQIRFQSTEISPSLPWNTIILFVPQQEAWIVERMGRFSEVLKPGVNFLIPVIDRVAYVQSLKEIAIHIPQQSAITSDNVTLHIDGVLYLRVIDPYRASYGVEDPEFAITQLAQTTMRSEIGKLTLDTVFREREVLNQKIIEALNKASDAWGIDCLRYEIRDIKLPDRIQEAMQMQVEADRKKRAVILESEGIRESEINVAEGRKQAKILRSEGEKTEEINRAAGDAQAIVARSKAKATSVDMIAKAVMSQQGQSAVSFVVAEEYIKAFSQLAHKNNAMLIGSDAGNASQMIAKAMAIYKTVENSDIGSVVSEPEPVTPEGKKEEAPKKN